MAAYDVLGLAAPTGRLVDAAHDALNAGVYSYSLGELATFRNPTWADCHPLFVSALKELEIVVPDHAGAVLALLEFHLERIVEGVASAGEVLNELYSVSVEHAAGVSSAALEPLHPFLGMYYELEEVIGYRSYREEQGTQEPDDPSIDQLYDRAASLAAEWCRDRWGRVMEPSWLTTTVVQLAAGISEGRAFDRLPILADALQDAGCDNDDILTHLRVDGPHLLGCHVVDLILKKT